MLLARICSPGRERRSHLQLDLLALLEVLRLALAVPELGLAAAAAICPRNVHINLLD